MHQAIWLSLCAYIDLYIELVALFLYFRNGSSVDSSLWWFHDPSVFSFSNLEWNSSGYISTTANSSWMIQTVWCMKSLVLSPPVAHSFLWFPYLVIFSQFSYKLYSYSYSVALKFRGLWEKYKLSVDTKTTESIEKTP